MNVVSKKNLLLAGCVGLATFGNAQANVKYVPGELIVKLSKGVESSLFNDKSLGVELKETIKLSYGKVYVVKTLSKTDLVKFAGELSKRSDVEFAEPNFIYEVVKPEKSFQDMLNEATIPTSSFSSPNDPEFSKLWGLNNDGTNEPGGARNGVEGADISAFQAWEITKGSRDVKIAVIDTGVDYNHPDLRENMWVNEAEANGEEGVDDDGNGFVDDIHGYDFANSDSDPWDGHSHGTHCAGTIAAVHDNSIGVAGVMSEATIVAVKFLSDGGSGSTANAIKAIDYATTVGVDLMSNSWGGGGYSLALKEAIERASDAGIIFTAAAGNSSSNNDTRPHYPSNYQVPNVVSVAAHTAQDSLATFSCYGRTTVHIAAPGHKILSTVKNGGYAVYSGTSMATPHVSGALGLLLAQEGRMDHAAMRERLMATSEPIRVYSRKTVSGGRLNAYNLLTDTRPVRNEPDPSLWQTLDLEEAFETDHPYGDNASLSRTIEVPGAKYIRARVKKYELETGYDFLKVKAASRAEIESISGNGQEYITDYVEGDKMILEFTSDRSVSRWGVLIEKIDVIYE